MSKIVIAGVEVRQDAAGRFSLNDLHRASGGERRHGPSLWLENQQTKELVAELASEMGDTGFPVSVVRGGPEQGSYAVKELVYAYAMWISAPFHLKVIRAYDQAMLAPKVDPMEVLNNPVAMRGLLLSYSEKVLELEGKVAEQAPKVAIHDRIADAEGSITLRETANTLQCPERKFILLLQEHDWVYRRAGHKSLLAYADKVKAGYLVLKQTPIRGIHTGEERLSEQVRVTPLGMTALARALPRWLSSSVPGALVTAQRVGPTTGGRPAA